METHCGNRTGRFISITGADPGRASTAEIRNLLKVGNVLEGSVRKVGNRVRVTAQLIKVEDGFHLWSATFERELTDIFAIQDEIAAAIAAAMRTTLNLGD